MSSRIAWLLFFASLIFLAGSAISCGGSSNSGVCSVVPGETYDVAGDWTLTVSSNGTTTSGPGVISTAGLALFFEPSSAPAGAGDTASLPTITGLSNCFSGNINSYNTPVNGGNSGIAQAQGSISSSTAISGSFQNTQDGTSGTFAVATNSPLAGSVTALSGSGWSGEIEGGAQAVTWSITMTAAGSANSMSFTGSGQLASGAVCDINGTFSQEVANTENLNVFDVSINFGAGCPFSNVTGLGFESSSDYFAINSGASGTYLYAVPSGGASVLEIFKPAGI